ARSRAAPVLDQPRRDGDVRQAPHALARRARHPDDVSCRSSRRGTAPGWWRGPRRVTERAARPDPRWKRVPRWHGPELRGFPRPLSRHFRSATPGYFLSRLPHLCGTLDVVARAPPWPNARGRPGGGRPGDNDDGDQRPWLDTAR